jgi:Predicted membrane protein
MVITQQLLGYLLYLGAGLAMLSLFLVLYVRITPNNEFRLIREGCVSAALSLGGALIGFSLTLASSALHSNSFSLFAFWAACAAFIQLLAYWGVTHLVPNASEALENNNIAVGALFGSISLAVGIVNAACQY